MNKTRAGLAVLAIMITATLASSQGRERRVATKPIEYGFLNSRLKLKQQIWLLIEQPVQDELKLSEEQAKKLPAVRLSIYKKWGTWDWVHDEDEEVWPLAIREMSEMIDKELKEVLSAAQHQRLKQIARRVSFRRYLGHYTLLLDPEYAKEFNLGNAQKAVLEGMRKGLEVSQLEAHNHPGDEKYKAKNYAYIKANDRKIEEMLTPGLPR